MASLILFNFNKPQILLKNINILFLINCNRRNFNQTHQNNSSNDVIDIYVNKFTKDSQTTWASSIAYKYVNSLLAMKQPIRQKNNKVNNFKDAQTLKDLLCVDPSLKNISKSHLNKLMFEFAQNGYVQGIKTLQNVSSRNGGYQDFEATALWFNGDVNKSLEKFLEVFKNYPSTLGRAIQLLHIATKNAIETKSEFKIVKMRQLVEKIAVKEITSLPLFYFWQKCFLSNKFEDQTHANHLLDQFPALIDQIRPQIIYLTQLSLTSNNIETVNRLIEIILRFKCKRECDHVFQRLFDHQCM